MANRNCRWNVGKLDDPWTNCGEPVAVRRKGEGYCAEHDPAARRERLRRLREYHNAMEKRW